MPSNELTSQLQSEVERNLDSFQLATVREYWDMAREIIVDQPVRKYYVRGSPNYCNIAFLTDRLVVDLDVTESQIPYGLVIRDLSSIEGVTLHLGPLATVPGSEDAQIVAIADLIGSEKFIYWVAATDGEREQLISFSKAIVEAIAKR